MTECACQQSPSDATGRFDEQRRESPRLCIVVPCYNEVDVLPESAEILSGKLLHLISKNAVAANSSVLFVDDGSSDDTWKEICRLIESNKCYEGIKLSRNRGHQNALLAGLMSACNHYDVTISIDCDGQDDVDAMDEMLDAYMDGCEIVYGVRSNRDADGLFKRSTAEGFYRLLNAMGVEAVYNHADYRLMSARALKALGRYKETNLFLRGMVPLVGYKSTCVYYKRRERIAGKSHYPLPKMINLAFNGITSLSVKPVRIIAVMGLTIAALSLILLIWALAEALSGSTVSGWASTVMIISFFGGLNLLALGVLGEYIGHIYLETKHRPRYIVEESSLPLSDDD